MRRSAATLLPPLGALEISLQMEVSLESRLPQLELSVRHGRVVWGHPHWWNFLLGLLA